MVVGSDTGSVMVYHGGSLCWVADAPPLALGAVDLHARSARRRLTASRACSTRWTATGASWLARWARGRRAVTQVVEGRELDYEEMDEEHRGLLQAIASRARPRAIPAAAAAASARRGRRAVGSCAAPSGIEGGAAGADGWAAVGAQTATRRVAPPPGLCELRGAGTIELVTVTVRCGAPLRPCREALELRDVRGGARTPLVVPVGFEVDPAHTARGADGAPPATLAATVVASYEVPGGSAPQVSKVTFSLPLALVAEAVPPVKVAEYKVTIDTNRPPPTLPELFPDVLAVSPAVSGGPVGANVLTLRYASGGEATILVSKNAGRYRVQARTFEAIALVAQELARRLLEHFGGARAPTWPTLFGLASASRSRCRTTSRWSTHTTTGAHVKDGAQAPRARRAAEPCNAACWCASATKSLEPGPSGRAAGGHLAARSDGHRGGGGAERDGQRRRAAGGELAPAASAHAPQVALSDAEALALEAYLTPEVLDSMEMGWEETTDAALVHLLKTALARGARERAPPCRRSRSCRATPRASRP